MGSALALAAMMLTTPTEPIALDGLIEFSDPATCEAAPAFAAIQNAVWPKGDQPLPVADHYRAAFGNPSLSVSASGWRAVDVPLKGTWRGIGLRGFAVSSQRGERIFQLLFALPVSQVGIVLAREGFRFGNAANGTRITLENNDGNALLTCEPRG